MEDQVRTAPSVPESTQPQPLVTARALSAILAVSESKVYELAADGSIPSIRVGKRSVRFALTDVMHALRGDAA
jgi:excisionase family DNA binding protein